MIAFPIGVLCCLGLAQRLIGSDTDNTPLALAVAAAFFCLLFSTICTALGFLGLLNAPLLWAMIGLSLGAALFFGKGSFHIKSALDIALMTIGVLPYFLLCTVPIWYRDSLTYHAAMAKSYAINGGFGHGDLIVFSFFPQSWQSFIAGWMVLFPEESFRMIAAWMVLFCTFAIFGIARQSGASRRQAGIAAALVLMTPTFLEFGSSLYVQNALILFAVLAFYWSNANSKKYIFLAGICAGFCASLKLSGLYIVFLLMLWRLWKRSFLLSFLLPAIVFASPFYIHNLIETGNPFYPMMWLFFGGEGWDEWRAIAYEETLRNYGAGRSVLDFILLPIRAIFTRDMVHQFQGSIGPIVSGLILWGCFKKKDPYWIFALMSWTVIWAFNVQQIRFLIPIIPVLIAISAVHIPRQKSKEALILILAALWCFEPAKYIWNRQATGELLTQKITAKEFLRQKLSENYPVEEWLNQQDDRKVWLVWMRGYHYYLNKPARLDNVFGGWRFERLLEENESPQQFRAHLNSEKIDTLVINHRFFLQNDNADLWEGRTAQLRMRFQALIDSAVLLPTYQHGPVTVYSLSESESSLEDSSN